MNFSRKKGSNDTTKIQVEINSITNRLMLNAAKKFGIKKSKLIELWLGMINLENEDLIEKIAEIRVEKEAEKIKNSRNALMLKLRQHGMLAQIAELDVDDLDVFVQEIRQRREKYKRNSK